MGFNDLKEISLEDRFYSYIDRHSMRDINKDLDSFSNKNKEIYDKLTEHKAKVDEIATRVSSIKSAMDSLPDNISENVKKVYKDFANNDNSENSSSAEKIIKDLEEHIKDMRELVIQISECKKYLEKRCESSSHSNSIPIVGYYTRPYSAVLDDKAKYADDLFNDSFSTLEELIATKNKATKYLI